jgi:nitroreductase
MGEEHATAIEGPPLARVESFELDLAVAMQKRRMHRAFKDRPVDGERMAKLIWAAGRAPTARPGIRQFLVTSRPDLAALIRQSCPGFINNAPTLVVIMSDLNRAFEQIGARGREGATRIDAGGAAAYMSLAAPALGLGLCITTSWTDSAVQEIFELPRQVRPELLIGVGEIASTPSPTMKARPPLVFDSSYGNVWRHDQ